MSTPRTRAVLTFAVVSFALFMITLDNLVVATALPSIRADLGASLESLEWTVNAYTLAFAVFLMPAAALGDRFGRKRVFLSGVGLFTLASALAALAPGSGELVAARALQGVGAAVIAPLSLTLLAAAIPEARRGLAIGAWSGVSGLGVALGPVLGGAVVEGLDWTWIFWINVPVGLVLLANGPRILRESHGPADRLDLPGLGLVGTGLLALTFAAVEAGNRGWTSAFVLTLLGAGVVLLGAFVAWERRAPAPMLPLRFFRSRAFVATNGVSFAMTFGVFGAIFFFAQFFQTAQGYSPFEAGLRTLPWTAMPMLAAPLAGVLSDRIGSRPLMAAGLTLQAVAVGWIASISDPAMSYASLVVPLVLGGTGMGLVFAPAANAVLGAVRPEEAGQASGANNAIREVGGVFGVAVLASVFAGAGSYASPEAFNDGLVAAAWVGAAVLAAGAVVALFVPRSEERRAALEPEQQPLAVQPAGVAAEGAAAA